MALLRRAARRSGGDLRAVRVQAQQVRAVGEREREVERPLAFQPLGMTGHYVTLSFPSASAT
ncbi:hypothetical protein GCM10010442_15840 [Kitasatospora kifunensis]